MDVAVLTQAGSQHGLVTHAQLRALGLSDKAIRHRVARGVLERVRPRVYRIAGVPASFEQAALAAVLTAGEGAVASHETALALWGLPLPGPCLLEVATPLAQRRAVRGVVVHRSGHLSAADVTVVRGVPVTAVERAAVDVSARHDVRAIGRIVDEALRRRLTTLERLHDATERFCPAPGRSSRTMGEVLRRRTTGAEAAESELEVFVFDALVRFGLPLPHAQFEVVVDGRKRRVDFCYSEELLALEPKGFNFHGQRARFDDDALRGNALVLAGYRVLEFTSAFTDWQIAVQVAAALGLEVPPRPSRAKTFATWCLERGLPHGGVQAPNTSVA